MLQIHRLYKMIGAQNILLGTFIEPLVERHE